MVGVPNLGAPKAFKVLINGDSFNIPGLNGDEMKKIGQNMPVVYDLAPSPQYDSVVGKFLQVRDPFVSLLAGEDVDYNTAVQHFSVQSLINDLALTNSQNLHTPGFDNYDIRSNGVDVYNIIGCKAGTFGKFTENIQADGSSVYDFPKMTTGDGTVPLTSAQTVVATSSHVLFAPKVDHGKMLSQDGIRQEIVNLLSGSALSTNGKILTHSEVQNRPDLCQIKGESINIKSPVAISAIDQLGNFSGLAEDGSIQNDIPGADYEIWGEHKYVFLPTDEGQVYTINLKGTNVGTFTLIDQSIDGDITTQVQVFSSLPVTTALSGQVNLGDITTLALDTNGDGIVDQTIQPSAVLDSDQSEDITAPTTTPVVIGTMGESGFYRSDVSITLAAEDPIVPGRESQTSGVLKTEYILDNATSTIYASGTPIVITTQQPHILKYHSTDKAGNVESEKILSFVIDKTTPEAVIQFNPVLKDLQFIGSDNFSISSAVSITDNDNQIILKDQAGNITEVNLKDKNRKRLLKADLKSLKYNGQTADLGKNQLTFTWLYDRKNNLKFLSQHIQAKKDFNILAIYNGKNTTLVGKDGKGLIIKNIKGLALLRVNTNKGDLGWEY